MHPYLLGLLGGMMMGVACIGLVLFNGRILGVSGVLGGALSLKGDTGWRRSFILGMLVAGAVTWLAFPAGFVITANRTLIATLIGGVLVGAGTQLGSGCTSGHGICGIGRMSKRSIAATLAFMSAGAAAVFLIQHGLGGEI